MAMSAAEGAGFGDWLRTTLDDVGRTPAQLARHLGVERAQVTAWLNGRARPTADQCGRLATALGVSTRAALSWAGYRGALADEPRAASAIAAPATSPRARRSSGAPPPGGGATTAPIARSEPMPVSDEGPVASAVPLPLAGAFAEPPGVVVAAGGDAPAATTPPAAGELPDPARRRRSARPTVRPAPAVVVATPPPPPAPPSPERLASLRALADDLETLATAYAHLQAEVTRLRAENDDLRAVIARARAVLDEDAAPLP